MSPRARFVLGAVAVGVGILVLAFGAGWAGGTLAARGTSSASSGASTGPGSVEAIASAAVNEAYSAAGAAASAEQAARAGTAGLCWQITAGKVTALSPPVAVPGGITCPPGQWRYTPVEPQPAPSGTGAPGG